MENKELVFLTVGTTDQKNIAKKIIAENEIVFDVPIIVVADDDIGHRIGSGGAILNLISQYYKPGYKIAIINSGGKSKRCINYAVKGKIFTNIEINGRTTTLLELLYNNVRKLMSGFDAGALICCSDILFNLQDFRDFFSENSAFCIRGDINTASRHGVMFHNFASLLTDYPHKCTTDKLERLRAKYAYSDFLIDTGTAFFNQELCLTLRNVANEFNIVKNLAESKTELNLYSDIFPLFARNCDINDYLSESTNNVHLETKKLLSDTISGYNLKVITIEKQQFRHFGSLRESLNNIIDLSGKKNTYVSMNSYIEDSFIGVNTVLDNVILKKGCHIGNNCIISDISLDEQTVIEDNKVVCGIKTRDNCYITIICDIDENPKKSTDDKELWEAERFYKGKNFNDSLDKFRNKADDSLYSLSYCVKNADPEYLYTRSKYITELKSFSTNDKYLKIREKVLKNHFAHTPILPCADFTCDKVEITLPLRINMSGTWTDAMPYCIDNGGQVINMAVTVNGKKPVSVVVEKLQNKSIELCNGNLKTVFDFEKGESIESDLSDFALHIAALKTIGITKDTVLANGFRLTTEVKDIDKGSGLGVSSILLGGCIKAFVKMFGLKYTNSDILNMVFVAEQIMGTGGGWQDQVGGLLPSIKSGTTQPGIEQKLQVDFIDLPDGFKKIFSERLIIIPTGQRHFGRFIVNDVSDRYLSGNKDSIYGHKEIRELNSRLINSFRNDDYKDFCYCINKHFELLKYISPLVSNQRIDHLINDCLEHITDAASVCGAGGGGYIFAVIKENITVEQAQAYIKRNYPYINSQVKQIQLLTEL